MTSPSNPPDRLRRHDLIRVAPAAWDAVLRGRPDLAGLPLLTSWAERGWPLMVRRPGPQDGDGIALGLPLPPSHGKARLAFVVPPEAIVSVEPPPLLDDAAAAAPTDWRPSLAAILDLAARHGLAVRVFGSLAWQHLTGLAYLSAGSDLDLLLPLPAPDQHDDLLAGLAAIEAAAPMRLDGELVSNDGQAVNWRELQTDTPEVLVKTRDAAVLLRRDAFLAAAAP
jgi:phosphoribosyl-dephospho-CoA transferase